MQINKRLSSLSFIVFSFIFITVLYAAEKATEQHRTKVKLTEDLQTIERTGKAYAVPSEQGPEFASYGLDATRLVGEVSVEPMPESNKKRIIIKWDTVENIDTRKIGKLDVPLESRLIVDAGEAGGAVKKGTKLTAQGDLNLIVAASQHLKETDQNSVSKEINNHLEPPQKEKDLKISQGGGASLSQKAEKEALLSGAAGPKGETVEVVEEKCDPRVDLTQRAVVEQSRPVEIRAGKRSAGGCSDTLTRYPIEKLYGGECKNRVDLVKGVVYRAYKETATVAGRVMTVTSCTEDAVKTIPIQETTDGCTIRHDLTKAASNQQKRRFYSDDGVQMIVSECQNSEITYPIETAYGGECQSQPDLTKGVAVRAYYQFIKMPSGETVKVTPCTLDANKTIPIQEAALGCSLRHDIGKGLSYLQTKKYFLEDTVQKIVSDCADTATTYNIVAVHGGECQSSPDLVKGVAYRGFKRIVKLPTGETLTVTDCSPDTEKTLPIETTTAGCTIRHDFTKNASFQQVKKFYMEDYVQNLVADCEDGSVSYAHYQTGNTCTNVVDSATKMAFITRRTAYKIGITENYATECVPASSGTPVTEEFGTCTPQYIHDIPAGQSYEASRFYYLNGGTRTYITSCASSTKTFVHLKNEAACTAIHNDSEKYSTLYATTYITTPSGNVSVSGCNPVLPNVSYTFLGRAWVESSSSPQVLTNSSGTTQEASVSTACSSSYYGQPVNSTAYNWIEHPSTGSDYIGGYLINYSFSREYLFNSCRMAGSQTTSTYPVWTFRCNHKTLYKTASYRRSNGTTYTETVAGSTVNGVCGGASKPAP